MSTPQTKHGETNGSQSSTHKPIYLNTSNKDEEYVNNNSNKFIWNENPSTFQEQKSARYIKYLKDQNLQLKQQLDQERQLSNYRFENDQNSPQNGEINQFQMNQLQMQVFSLQEEFDRYKSENSSKQKDNLVQIEALLKEKQQNMNEREKLSEENKKLNQQLAEYAQKNRDLNFEEQEIRLQKENEKLKEENDKNKKEIDLVKSQIKEALSEKAKLQQKINSYKNENQKLKKSQQQQQQQNSTAIKKRSISPKPTTSKQSNKSSKNQDDDQEELHHIKIRIIKKRSSTPKSDKMTLTLPNEFVEQPDKDSQKLKQQKKRSQSPKVNKKKQDSNKEQEKEKPSTNSIKKRSVSPKPTATKKQAISNKPSQTNKEKMLTSSAQKRSTSPKTNSQKKRSVSPAQNIDNKQIRKRSLSPKPVAPKEIILTEESKQLIDLNARIQVLSQQLKEKSELVDKLHKKNTETKEKSEQLVQDNEELNKQINKYINKTNIYNSTIIRQKNNLDQKDKEIDELQLKQSKIKKLIKIANNVKNTNIILQERNRKLEQKILDSSMNTSVSNNQNEKSNFNEPSISNSEEKGKIESLIQKMMIDSAEKSQQIDELSQKISQLGSTQKSLSETVDHLQNQMVESTLQGVDEINLSE